MGRVPGHVIEAPVCEHRNGFASFAPAFPSSYAAVESRITVSK